MHQSPADNTLPIAPESAKCCEAMRCGLRSLKGPQVVNRIEGPQFLRISLYVLQEYLRSPKINKQLPQHHKQTLVDFLHAMYFSTAIPNVGLLSLPRTNQPRNWSPCAQSLWSLQAAQQPEDKGCYLTLPYLPHPSAMSRADYVFGDMQKEGRGKRWQL